MTDEASAELERIRTHIEGIDRQIIALVADRLDLCRKVAPLKVVAGLEAPTRDAGNLRLAKLIERKRRRNPALCGIGQA